MNDRIRAMVILASGLLTILLFPTRVVAEEMTIPRGTAVDVLVEDALSSRTAKVGDEFRAVLVRALWIHGQLAFPRGTVVEGRVDAVNSRADGSHAGFVGVKFVRMELPGSGRQTAAARLGEFGSKKERVDVVLIGRVVSVDPSVDASAGDETIKDPARFQTSETDVEVAAGTLVNLQFAEPLQLSAADTDLAAPSEDARVARPLSTIAAAQRALSEQGGYQGRIDGVLSTETRQAILQFQLHRGRVATGDLDEETMRELGVSPPPAR